MKPTAFFIITLFLFTGCAEQDNANLLVTSLHGDKPVGQSMVYLIEGHDLDPLPSLEDYTYVQRSDGNGETYFSDLRDGDYTLYTSGYFDGRKVDAFKEIILAAYTRNRTTSVMVDLE